MKSELVLFINRSFAKGPELLHTAIRREDDVVDALAMNPEQAWFGSRALIESDPSKLQLIPYIIVQVEGVGYLVHQRKGSEGRLNGKFSLAVGGHINIDDAVSKDGRLDVAATIRAGIVREIEEELPGIRGGASLKFLGTIMPEKAELVDRVHLGLCYALAVGPDGLNMAEITLNNPEVLSLERARELDLENWSRDLLQKDLVKAIDLSLSVWRDL